MNIVLWILQVILALLFLWGGFYKLVKAPLDQMAPMLGISVTLLKFISVCEVLGGLGLVLPAALRIKPVLTPLAAMGLLIIMVGAVAITIKTAGASQAILPLVTGILLFVVAYGRWRLTPISEK